MIKRGCACDQDGVFMCLAYMSVTTHGLDHSLRVKCFILFIVIKLDRFLVFPLGS